MTSNIDGHLSNLIMTRQCTDTQESTELYDYWKGTIGGQNFRRKPQITFEDVQNANDIKSTTDLLEWR